MRVLPLQSVCRLWRQTAFKDDDVAMQCFVSVKSLVNKNVTFESSKKKAAKTGTDKPSSKKKEGGHPKKCKAPKEGDKKEVQFKGHTWY
jgi:hypothetical protein